MLVPLTQGAYTARSIIASAQRCINLYPEQNTKDSPVPVTHYPTPGLTFQSSLAGPVRSMYEASNGNLYIVTGNLFGSQLYYGTPITKGISSVTLIGNFTSYGVNPVSMADNGIVLVIVDGTTNGWALDLATNSLAKISDPNYLGASRVDYLDTFFMFNMPGTNEWYISLSEANFQMLTGVTGAVLTGTITGVGSAYSNGTYSSISLSGGSGTGATANITVAGNIVTNVTIVSGGTDYEIGDALGAAIPGGTGFVFTVDTVDGTAFDPLDVATKSTFPDPIITFIVMHAEIWLIGSQTTEIWYNAGAPDFTFQILPGVFVEHGCAAQYSIAKQDLSIYWLSRDRQGQYIVLKGNGYAAHRISTFAIENEISNYSVVSDAIGWTYQQRGHTYYVLTFPTADKTWVYDESTQLWHERASLQYPANGTLNLDGDLHKVIYNSCGICGGQIYVGDYLGSLWLLDINNYTENGVEIPRIRTWPHLLNAQKRVSYSQFIADMECGTDDSTVTGDGTSSDDPPLISLRWSDDRGKTYGNYVQQSLGAIGQYLNNIQFRRLGLARDRVFELSWSVPTKTALNGAWIEFTSSQT